MYERSTGLNELLNLTKISTRTTDAGDLFHSATTWIRKRVSTYTDMRVRVKQF